MLNHTVADQRVDIDPFSVTARTPRDAAGRPYIVNDAGYTVFVGPYWLNHALEEQTERLMPARIRRVRSA